LSVFVIVLLKRHNFGVFWRFLVQEEENILPSYDNSQKFTFGYQLKVD